MAKPICIIRVSLEALQEPSGRKKPFYEFQKIFDERLPDYHVFVIPAVYDHTEPQEYFTFQVFYEKDFTQIEYNELKEIINRSLN